MKMVHCDKYDCFQNFCGKNCRLLVAPLTDADIRECPFYKTEEQVNEGRLWAHNELLKKGRKELIEAYEYNPQRRGSW